MTQKELARLMSCVFNIMILIYIVCSETTINKFSFQFISLHPIYV